jgi:hypothetical protein
MKKWLTVLGVLMLFAWAPFFYAELTSSALEKKGRSLPADDPGQEPIVAEGATPADEGKPAPSAPAEPAVEAPQPPAPPTQQSPAKAGVAPSAGPVAKSAEPPVPGDGEGDTQADDDQADAPPPPPSAVGPTLVFKQAFDTQPRDPLWAADTEARLRALFREDVPADLLQSASCRKAVCRLELRWTVAHATAYVSVYETMHKEFGDELGVEPVGSPDDHGQLQVNLYLARKGYTVADLSK